MNNGISVYLGLNNTIDENISLIESAHACGIKRLFTSLHIPETDFNALKEELHAVLSCARRYGMEIISDVSPAALTLLQMDALDPDKLLKWGISTIRLDYGWTEEKIAQLSRSGLKLQFNASTATREFLDELQQAHVDFAHIDALHNFYPREGTGLDLTKFTQQNKLLREYDLKAAAFIPSYSRTRPPLYKGLPTLEEHRWQSADFAMRHMAALGLESVFIGDSLPTERELQSLGSLHNDTIMLKGKLRTNNSFIKFMLAQNTFSVRPDSPSYAVRLTESRALCKGHEIMPEYRGERRPGCITLDNIFAGRYMGELQIIMQMQPADETVNIIAELPARELKILSCVNPAETRQIKIELQV